MLLLDTDFVRANKPKQKQKYYLNRIQRVSDNHRTKSTETTTNEILQRPHFTHFQRIFLLIAIFNTARSETEIVN